jgi:hypothetical protein
MHQSAQSPSALPSYPPTQSIAPAHQPVSLRKIFSPLTPVLSRAQFASISFQTEKSSLLPSSNLQPTPNKLKSKLAKSLFCRLQRLLLRGRYWRYDLCANAYGDGDGDDNCDVRAGEEGEARSRGGGGYHELWKDVMGR